MQQASCLTYRLISVISSDKRFLEKVGTDMSSPVHPVVRPLALLLPEQMWPYLMSYLVRFRNGALRTDVSRWQLADDSRVSVSTVA